MLIPSVPPPQHELSWCSPSNSQLHNFTEPLKKATVSCDVKGEDHDHGLDLRPKQSCVLPLLFLHSAAALSSLHNVESKNRAPVRRPAATPFQRALIGWSRVGLQESRSWGWNVSIHLQDGRVGQPWTLCASAGEAAHVQPCRKHCRLLINCLVEDNPVYSDRYH